MNWLMELRATSALEDTAVPLWVGFSQGRAPFRKWLLSPITAVIWLFIAGIVAAVLRWLLERVGIADRSTTAAIVTLTCFVVLRYAGGRLSARSQLPEVRGASPMSQATTAPTRPRRGGLKIRFIAYADPL